MDIAFVAGFGPIGTDPDDTFNFWSQTIGISFDEVAPDYYHASGLPGTKAFALWPLSQAAQATFGTDQWPEGRPVPQAWIELEVSSPEAVADAVEELRAKGQEILIEAHEEPWGQTTARLMSPEGMLVGISYLPSFHADENEQGTE
ncbi:VOC family protein [Nonomuraea pusilla]|uniref:VOC family protein n=1 Tax=Nonomuraea pusilla TaxID=46177 RepID=UPI00332920CE